MNPADYETIRIDIQGNGVVVATLDRPDDLNPPIGQMHSELSRLAPDFDYDPACRVLVITGSGRAFAAGRSKTVLGERDRLVGWSGPPRSEERSRVQYESLRLIEGILECRKPIISAVNGYAMGLGANIALLCDIVVASSSAVFADTHVVTGVGAGDGGQVIWPLLIGVNRAKYFLMTGDRLSAEDAFRLGLVNFIVDGDRLMDRALEIANRLARGPLDAIIASKWPINHWMRSISAHILPLSLTMERNSAHSADARETMRALAENREPRYSRE